jgi:acyl carrier protein
VTERNRVIDVIYLAIDEVNLQLPPGRRIVKSEQSVLIGDGGTLDSLAFLNLIVATEEKVGSTFSAALPLVSSLMESDRDQLPRTISDLADLICRRLQGRNDG